MACRGLFVALALAHVYIAVGGLGFASSPPHIPLGRGIASRGMLCEAGVTHKRTRPATRGRTSRGMIGRLRASLDQQEKSSTIVLDFDGVICDSAEATRIAYRAAMTKWPDVMKASTDIDAREAGVRSSWVGYKWHEYEEDCGEDIPRWLEEKLKQVRPVASDPADLVLAARLCVSEAIAGRNHKDTGRRPLTAGEIIENWEEMKEILYLRCNATPPELGALYEQERNRWRQSDEEGWSQCACVYPGVAEALRGKEDNIYVLTSDLDGRAAKLLLELHGVEVADERVVECLGDKADALFSLKERVQGGRISYVEDDVATLQRMAGDLRFANGVSLLFATWGHSTSKNKASVAAWPRVKSITAEGLADLL